jgi:hypothetical protein
VTKGAYHYVRTTGVDGGVESVDGPAVGVGLDELVRGGLPPVKVALEIVAGLCEILDIAEEDGEVHGKVSPTAVFLDDTGAVSLEYGGVGAARGPERVPKGALTDRYGLGVVAFRLLSPTELPQLPNDDPDSHDDGVIEAIINLSLGDLPEAVVGDVQWFLGKLLSYEPDDRPSPLDAWRSFIAFADATDGPSIEKWSKLAVEGGGERRKDVAVATPASGAAPAAPAPAPKPSENLGGPTKSAGPLRRGAIDFSAGGGKAGQATAFWSKDAMKAALDHDDDDDDAFKPAPGGGSSTSFWTKEQIQAMAAGASEAPRPKRGGKRGDAGTEPPPVAPAPPPPGPRPTPTRTPAPPAGRSKYYAPTRPPEIDDDGDAPVLSQPGGAWRPDGPPKPPPPRRPTESSHLEPRPIATPPGPPPSKPLPPPHPGTISPGGPPPKPTGIPGPAAGPSPAAPIAAGPVVAGPVAAGPTPIGGPQPLPPPPQWEEPEAEGGSMTPILIGVALVLVALVCLGVLTLGGGAAWFLSGDAGDVVEPTSAGSATTPSPAPSTAPSPGRGDRDTAPRAAPAAAPATSPPTPSPAPAATPAPSPRPTPSPAPTTRPTPPPAPSVVRPGTSPRPTPTPAPAPAPGGSVRPRPRPGSAPAPAPAPAPASGPVNVTFRSSTPARLECGNGQRATIDGSRDIQFAAYDLPVACYLDSDGGRAALLVTGAGTVSCSGSGPGFACSGP